MVIIIRLVYRIRYKLALFSILLFSNVSFIHSTILDSLQAFQVISKKETLIINKLCCFEINMSQCPCENIRHILYL